MGECCSNSEKYCGDEASNSSCNCSCCKDVHEKFMKFLLETADCAWTEVLKEKIKEHILATQNERMTEIAKIAAETNNTRWKHKMEKRKVIKEFHEKLYNAFSKK